jgi:Do/DeqQ family serine protease
MKLHRHLLAAVAATGLLGAGVLALHSTATPAHAAPAGVPTDGSIADVAERVVDSVVNIAVSRDMSGGGPADFDPFFNDPFSPGFGTDPGARKAMAKGSGVIVTASGRILTNAHVVDGFDDIKVTLQDGTELDAKVVGKDTHADLAVLQLKGHFPPLKPMAFGDSSQLRLGDIVLAVGDGLGVGKSVSMGIVSAKGRGNVGIEEYEDFIQTDAAINPGNSGGALVNLRGELVGINTAIASKSGGYSGIGFAIPSNMARPIMDMLVRDGKVARGYLGIVITTVDARLAKEDKLPTNSGVEIKEVAPNGPAAQAHLGAGDVVVALDGQVMKDGGVLRNQIAMTKPGSTVALDVIHHDGSRATIKAKLGELPEKQHVAQQQQQQQQGPFGNMHGRHFQPPQGWPQPPQGPGGPPGQQGPQGQGWEHQQGPNGEDVWSWHSP